MSKRRIITLAEVLPRDLPSLLMPGSKLSLGYDVATTTKAKSNPSSLSLLEQIGMNTFVRMILRWKSADPSVSKAILFAVLMLLAPRRPVALVVDSSNEKYYAAQIQRELAALVNVILVSSGESTIYLGEKMSFKVYLGNLLVNALDDGQIALPDVEWVSKDFRLVKRTAGSFETDVDEAGNHGDTFDSTKLGLHGFTAGGGPAEAFGARVGQFGGEPSDDREFLNQFARNTKQGDRLLC
jgi:phage FluMu gp28-like protein